jgi:hypothetical protein
VFLTWWHRWVSCTFSLCIPDAQTSVDSL